MLFTNASEGFVKGKRQNYLNDEHIARIVETNQNRPKKPIERFSRRVSIEEGPVQEELRLPSLPKPNPSVTIILFNRGCSNRSSEDRSSDLDLPTAR